MKKVIKNISRVLFSLLLIFSIFSIVNVLAEEAIFQITNISVKEKSDKVTVNDVSISGGELNNDIEFTDLNDYIKYDITIKNVSNDTYTIKSISDNNNSNYLEYTYDDLSNVKLNSSEEKTFELQIKYVQETSNLTISDQAVSLTLTYEKDDGTTGSEIITNNNNDSSNVLGGSSDNITNPKTGDNITIYLLLGIISLVGLTITTVNRRYLNKSLMSIVALSMVVIPYGVKADSERFEITFATNKFQNSYTELVSGVDFNLIISKISSGNDKLQKNCEDEEYGSYCYIVDTNYTEDDDEYWEYQNSEITSIKKATHEQFNLIKDSLTEENIVSKDNSTVSTYVWFDNGILYYYANSNKIVLDSDCDGMFYSLASLKTIDLSVFDTSNVVNMNGMFMNCSSLEELDLSKFNTSNVVNMNGMFMDCSSLEELDLSKFNTSNVTDMANMFWNDSSLNKINLSSFDTSKVKSMSFMFYSCSNLLELDLSSFDFSALFSITNDIYFVQPLDCIFVGCEKLKTIYVSPDGFNDDFYALGGAFGSNNDLVGGNGSKYVDYSDANTHNMHETHKYFKIDGGAGNPGFLTDIADKPQN